MSEFPASTSTVTPTTASTIALDTSALSSLLDQLGSINTGASSSSRQYVTTTYRASSSSSSSRPGYLYTVSAVNSPLVAALQTSDVAYCAPATLSWSGGIGPYSVRLAAVDSDLNWSSPNWSPKSPAPQPSIIVFNNIASRYLLVEVTDSDGAIFSKALPVSGGGGSTCVVGGSSVSASATESSATGTAPGSTQSLAPGAVAGIVLGCLAALAVLCLLLWRWRLASKRPRIRVIPFKHHDDVGDRGSITSAQTRWTTFTGRTATQPGNGLHADMQDVEEGRSPISAPISKRTKGQAMQPPVWASAQSLPTPSPPESETPYASDDLHLLGPGTQMTRSSPSSEQDRSSIYDQTRSGTGLMRSPFDDDQSAVTLSGGFSPDEKTPTPLKTLWPPRERLADAIAAIRNGDHSPLSAHPSNRGDVSPLSSRDLEALADLVADRLTQREGSSARRTRSSNGSEMPPRYS